MGTTAILLVGWGAANAACILYGMRRATVMHRRRARQAAAAMRYRSRSVRALLDPYRMAARSGEPFPPSQRESDWRYEDERSRQRYHMELVTLVAHLFDEYEAEAAS